MVKSVFTDAYRVLLGSLTAARKAAGMTQQQLADRLDKPQSFVSKYERGERRLDVVEFLAIARCTRADPCRIIREVKKAAS